MPYKICDTCQAMYYERRDGTRPHSCQTRKKGKRGPRKERTLIRCAWIDCTASIAVIEMWGKDGRKMYRLDSFNGAGLVRHPICEIHRELIRKHLGDGAIRRGIRCVLEQREDNFSRQIKSPLLRLMLYIRDGEACRSCKSTLTFKQAWHIDHAQPIFKGGSHSFSNLQVLCPACHAEKTRVEQSEASKAYWVNKSAQVIDFTS